MASILRACRDRMIAFARDAAPDETCGFLIGHDGMIAEPHAMKNVAVDPKTRFEFDPMEHFKFLKRMEREGKPIVGVYHSHPASPAYPSQTDVARATLADGTPTYPGYTHIIVSLSSQEPSVRAFQIRQGGRIEEEELVVSDPQA